MSSTVRYLAILSSSYDDVPQLAMEELQKNAKASDIVRAGQAKIIFRLSGSPRCLSSLCTAEKIYVIIEHKPSQGVVLSEDGRQAEDELAAIAASSAGWPDALEAWRSVLDLGDATQLPRSFRATGKKAGKRFSHLSSNGISEAVGDFVARAHGWSVSLTEFDINVHVQINDEVFAVLLPLYVRTDRRQHAPSCPGLSQPVAWAIARSVDIRAGDVVCDPMCGAGIILLEAAQCWRHASFIGFDEDDGQLQRFGANLDLVSTQVRRQITMCRADAGRLPMASASVDAIVTDLPFGKQFGSLEENVVLYPAVVGEIRRVLRTGSGRAALLTNMKNSTRLAEVFAATPDLWEVTCRRRVLLGFMEAVLFVAHARPCPEGKEMPAESWRLPWEHNSRGRARWMAEKVASRPPLEAARGRKMIT